MTESLIPRALDRLATKATLGATELDAALNVARQDLLVIQNGIDVVQLAAMRSKGPVDPQVDSELRQRIAARFVAALRSKPDYVQIRVIGLADEGRELVRADRGGGGGAARVVPDSELTQQGERDYVKRTMSLSRSDIYVSPIVPDTGTVPADRAAPVLQIGMSVRAPDGRPFGVAFIDFSLGPKFARIKAGIAGDNHLAIVNGAGDYLLDSIPQSDGASAARTGSRI